MNWILSTNECHFWLFRFKALKNRPLALKIIWKRLHMACFGSKSFSKFSSLRFPRLGTLKREANEKSLSAAAEDGNGALCCRLPEKWDKYEGEVLNKKKLTTGGFSGSLISNPIKNFWKTKWRTQNGEHFFLNSFYGLET